MTLVSFAMCFLFVSSCSRNPRSSSLEGGSVDLESVIATAPEASHWLEGNGHDAALASNRFMSTEEALDFVKKLYDAGAARVVIEPKSVQTEPEDGGDYADSIIVKFEATSPNAKQVIAIGKREAESEGMDLGPEIQHGFMVLWWD